MGYGVKGEERVASEWAESVADAPSRWIVRERDSEDSGDSAESASAEGGAIDAESTEPDPDSPHLDDLTELEGLDEGEFITELGNRIVKVAAHAAALEYRLLVMIAEFDRRRGWERSGYSDCADWLVMHTGMSRITARERVRMARALEGLPKISETMARGELSYSKVRALVRVATPENEDELLPMARESTANRLEREVSRFREIEQWGDLGAEARRHLRRYLKVADGPDGMVRIRGEVPPEVGALLMKVLDALVDELFRGNLEWSADGGTWGVATDDVTPDQRRADALLLLADRAMAMAGGGVGDPAESVRDAGGATGDNPAGSREGARLRDRPRSNGTVGPESASAESPAPPCGCIPRSPSAERYTVLVHVDYETLVGKTPGRADLEGRMPVSPDTVRRLSCDGSVVRVVRGSESEVLDVGRKTRVVPPAIRRALRARDGGCRFPGCDARYVDAHHIKHWADGGTTALGNLVLLCPTHHRGVHEGGFRVRLDRKGIPFFLNRDGFRIPDRPPPSDPGPPDPVGTLVRTHRFRGIDPGIGAGTSRKRVRPEIEFQFREALDPPV